MDVVIYFVRTRVFIFKYCMTNTFLNGIFKRGMLYFTVSQYIYEKDVCSFSVNSYCLIRILNKLLLYKLCYVLILEMVRIKEFCKELPNVKIFRKF